MKEGREAIVASRQFFRGVGGFGRHFGDAIARIPDEFSGNGGANCDFWSRGIIIMTEAANALVFPRLLRYSISDEQLRRQSTTPFGRIRDERMRVGKIIRGNVGGAINHILRITIEGGTGYARLSSGKGFFVCRAKRAPGFRQTDRSTAFIRGSKGGMKPCARAVCLHPSP